MNPQTDDQRSSTTSPALLTALTTEHYTLQSARSATVLEANGRGQLYVAALSGAVVALALVAELDGLGRIFNVFAISLLPAVLALGLTTYVRLADLAVQDAFYARAIGRIRAFYLSIDPTAASYWLLPAGDGPHAVMHQAGLRHTRWHHMSHAATMVAALTSVVAGGMYALTAHLGRSAPPPLVGVGAGIVAIAVFVMFMLDQRRRWRRAADVHPTLYGHDGAPLGSVALAGHGQVPATGGTAW